MKYSIKGQQFKHYKISSTLLRPAHWLWHRCFLWFHQSHLLPMLLLLLRHGGCQNDITGALFCSLGTLCGWFPFSPFACVLFRWPFACFCHKMTFYQLGAYDHSVLYTTAQLTEGRSARDQPKQPPAKKKLRTRTNPLSVCSISNLHDTFATDGYGTINRLYPQVLDL